MNLLKLFEVNVCNVIFDSVIQRMYLRFEKHKELFADFNCLDPNNFYTKDCLSKDALKIIFTKILPFQTSIFILYIYCILHYRYSVVHFRT